MIEVVSPTLRAGLRSLVRELPDVLGEGTPKRPVHIVDEQGLTDLSAGANVIAVLTTVNADAVCRAAERGARGVVHRDGPADDLRHAIVRVADGGCWVSPVFSEELHGVLAGAARSRRRRDRWDGLSTRQQNVLRMLIAGRSTAAIAQELGIAPGTVKGHVSEVLRRFGVATRAEAVAAALDVSAP